MVERRVALVPTLTLFQAELAREGAPDEVRDQVVALGQRQLGDFAAAGRVVLFGTDSGYMDWLRHPRRVAADAGAGMDWRQILASLTTAPAAHVGGGLQRARVERGEAADLVLLGADPTHDATAFASVGQVLRAGRPVYTAPSVSAD